MYDDAKIIINKYKKSWNMKLGKSQRIHLLPLCNEYEHFAKKNISEWDVKLSS